MLAFRRDFASRQVKKEKEAKIDRIKLKAYSDDAEEALPKFKVQLKEPFLPHYSVGLLST